MFQHFFHTLFFLAVFTITKAQSYQIIVHNSEAIKAGGKYSIFGTGPGIESAVLPDKENGTKHSSQVFGSMPERFKEEVSNFNGHIWAPDIVFRNEKYYLHYSISSFGSNLSCIDVASNTTLDRTDKYSKWVDHGIVIRSFSGLDDWKAIDPNIIFDEEGTPLMENIMFSHGYAHDGAQLKLLIRTLECNEEGCPFIKEYIKSLLWAGC